MTASNTYGRGVWLPLTNKSGAGVVAGDVVVIDTANNDAFTTTTSANFTGGVGVAQGTIASNAVGLVAVSGYVTLVNVNASVTRGHFGATFTAAKQATDAGATRGVGTFCQFLTGGTTPDALLYPVDLLGSSLTNPMTTKGDIILGDTGGTPTRLGAGTSGYLLTSAGAGAFPTWSAAAAPAALASASYSRTSANYTTTGTTFADVDGTNLSLTITTGAHRVLISLVAMGENSGSLSSVYLDVTVDGTRLGGTNGIIRVIAETGTIPRNASFAWVTDALSAASHTFKLQWRVDGNTGKLYGDSTETLRFAVTELLA